MLLISIYDLNDSYEYFDDAYLFLMHIHNAN